jgi:hypothetical protein
MDVIKNITSINCIILFTLTSSGTANSGIVSGDRECRRIWQDIYYYVLQAGKYQQAKKMVLLK